MDTQAYEQLSGTEFQSDPHSVYARLRAEGPVHKVILPGGTPTWLVSRYADVRQALTDPRLIKKGEVSPTGPNQPLPEGVAAATNTHMLSVDPPDHTRLRRLVSAAFTARRVELLRPRIQKITDDLLDAMTGSEPLDLIDSFAFPLPIQVICELLGVPTADQTSFRDWSNAIVSGAVSGEDGPRAFASMLHYIAELIQRKRATPGDDLLSALIAVRDEGDQLSEDELSSTIFLLLIAGHETTVNLIGNAALVLLSERERWERLRREPELLPSAVEEVLRYESPVATATFRFTSAPVEIGGTLIPAGEIVLIGLLSGNRDPERFADPHRLELGRADNQHLAFGHGIHYCLGAPLARLEAQVALTSLMARYPALELAANPDELSWRPGVLLRGVAHLPVRLG